MKHEAQPVRFLVAGLRNGSMKRSKRACRLLIVWMWNAVSMTKGPFFASTRQCGTPFWRAKKS